MEQHVRWMEPPSGPQVLRKPSTKVESVFSAVSPMVISLTISAAAGWSRRTAEMRFFVDGALSSASGP